MKVDKTKWEKVRLGEMCEFLSRGKSPKYDDSQRIFPVFAQKCNLKNGGMSLRDVRFLNPSTVSSWQDFYKLRNGDILINSTGTGTVGRVGIFNSELLNGYPFIVPDSHVSVVRLRRGSHDARFVYYALRGNRVQKYFEDNLRGSTNQKELYINTVKDTKINAPSLLEQQAIAAELDAIQLVIDKLQEQLSDYDTLAQSIFNEMFGDVAYNDRAWETKTLQEIGTLKNGLNYDKGESGHSIWIVGVGDFKNLTRIDDISTLSQVELSQPVPSEYLLKDEDMVFVRSNGNKELVGRCVEVYTQNADVTFSGFCIRFRKEQDDVINKYLLYLLTNNEYKKQHILKSNGIGIKSINQKILGCMPIPLPPLSLQCQFAEHIESIELQKSLLRQQIADAWQLMDSRMQYYFE